MRSIQLLLKAVSVNTPIGAMALKKTTAHAECEQQPSPAAELGALRAYAAAADSDVGSPLQIAALDPKADHRQQHEHQRERRRLAPARGIAADGSRRLRVGRKMIRAGSTEESPAARTAPASRRLRVALRR